MTSIRIGSECTTKTVYSQLIDGNRALDLRLNLFENDIYIAQVLQGLSLSDVLLQAWNCLQKTNDEIIFMTLRYPCGFNQTYIDRLALLLDAFIISRILITLIEYSRDLLNHTYAKLITNNISRIIIVTDDTINPDVNSFFSASNYSPPDGCSQTLYGFYTNTNDINVVIKMQTANYIYAQEILAPSSIYMTLTPAYNDMISIIINNILVNLHPLTKSVFLSILRTLLLSENINNFNLTYTSLYNIYIQQNVISRRHSIVRNIQSIPSSSTNDNMFLLYTDFDISTITELVNESKTTGFAKLLLDPVKIVVPGGSSTPTQQRLAYLRGGGSNSSVCLLLIFTIIFLFIGISCVSAGGGTKNIPAAGVGGAFIALGAVCCLCCFCASCNKS
ncbi:unnamed protein product [Adineta ricciae]|uniref:Uncharacterized protein n=1 Tax=Adineta ricciae TaxID=249248 RepID=A0A815G559_ADIRI|nr:unnamed protein product [Adineta ricciae]CAF1400894.1 unnamed protein product [Adineta ricciae]